MKVKSSLRLLCKGCKFVRRRKRNFVVCASNPKHKQRSGFHTFAASEEVQQAWQKSRPTLHHNSCCCHGCGGSREVFSYAAPLGGMSVGDQVFRLR